MVYPHKHEVGSPGGGNPDYNGLTDWKKPSDGSDQELPVCHCEEGIGKTADTCNGIDIDVPAHYATAIDNRESGHTPVGYHASPAARAPPPLLFPNYWLMNARTGVYRL
ncbi:MAG: hypothetical protein H7A51_05510 [Akkermansiaceae bacterium]|nr:hypothetical protein [Akkermansiaceae bacterium]